EVVERSGSYLVPQLWGEGILRSVEATIALTTADMLPGHGWAQALLRSYSRGDWTGVGGPILPGLSLRSLDRAIYWLRYSRFAVPRADGETRDIAGDNGSYRRERLSVLADEIRHQGFWENEAHDSLRPGGARFFFSSNAVVRFNGG